MKIVCIVEGDGETGAVPVLLRRMAQRLRPGIDLRIAKPIKVHRNKLLKAGELERTLELAARQCGEQDGILVLLDADDDCPATLAPQLLQRAAGARRDRQIRVILANREFEAWFLAAAASIAGKRGLQQQLEPPADPESIRDAKGWLRHRCEPGRSYRETVDQPALAAVFDLDAARRAPSFDKLFRDLERWLQGAVGSQAPSAQEPA